MLSVLTIFTHLTKLANAQEQADAPAQPQPQLYQELPPQIAQMYPQGVYDAAALAQLNGNIPPYDPSYPASNQGYLVPVWVDDVSEIPDADQYNWVDPNSDTEVWAHYGVAPEQISELTGGAPPPPPAA